MKSGNFIALEKETFTPPSVVPNQILPISSRKHYFTKLSLILKALELSLFSLLIILLFNKL